MFEAEPRILARVHSFDDEFSLPGFAKAIEVRPVHRGVSCAHAGHVDAVVHRPFADARTRIAFMAIEAQPQVLAAGAKISFAVAAGSVVDSKSEHRDSGGFDAMQNFLASVPGSRRVKLLPDRTPKRFNNIFDGRRSSG